VIVGTAGHIDHGKTTLVRALTGVDTDRLKEEKARGISIELGYAYTPLADGDVLGFVDVPGHERLVHTMVAGACGIDFALLVIAADDGVMPQTREHLAILELLGITRGAVALTKIDRVDTARLDDVRTEVAAALASTALHDMPIFPLNATLPGDPGVAALQIHLHDAAANMPMRCDDGLFRLAVDRVFTLPGHGTMVTGTVFSGRVKTGESLVLMPAETPVRVRSIHAQNRLSESGRAGQRCALNLAGIAKGDIERGNWIADPRLLAPTTRIDVRLHLLEDAETHLTQWSPLHVHLGTAHCVAHVVLLEQESLLPGQGGRAQFVFDTPVCAVPGDGFIARNAQAARTVGGGRVLDPFAPTRKRRTPQRRRYLDALEKMLVGEGIAALLQQAPYGLRTSELMRLTGEPQERMPLPTEAITVDIAADAHDRFVVLRAHWNALRERVVEALRDFHAQVPDEPGPDSGRLRRIVSPELHEALWRALINELVRDGVAIRSGAWVHLPGHAVTLSESDEGLAGKLLPLIAAGRFDPPWLRDLADAVQEPEDRVRRVLGKLVRQGRVFQVVPDLFYDQRRIRELAALISELAQDHGAVEAARYRDAIGVGRKRSIQILEFFDRLGYTRRVRSAHVLRTDGNWFV
jgi:selenocysteine-specific elongation factor